MTDTNLDERKQALIQQINSLREVFDKAHDQALKAQEAFEVLKAEMNQMKIQADDQIVAIKAESEAQIKDILVQIENTKREAANQINTLRAQIAELK